MPNFASNFIHLSLQHARKKIKNKLIPLAGWIFMSRWLQAPLYIGLIVAQGVYVWQFWLELVHLISLMGSKTPTETEVMLIVLGLIDVVMISNLLIMVIVGVGKPLYLD